MTQHADTHWCCSLPQWFHSQEQQWNQHCFLSNNQDF